MAYVLKKRTDEDKQYFIDCGVKSPFGGKPTFAYHMVENIDENVKMIFMGGQGIMTEDGEEWSEMAAYLTIVWNEKNFLVEFYRKKIFTHNKPQYDTFEVIYKIKKVYSLECENKEKQEFIKILKDCLVAYGNEGIDTSICEKVIFMDTEVRWV